MAQIDYKALGDRIRKARKKNNMTQERLAEACSLSTAHIGHIERGTRVPSVETLFRISEELSVSVDWLLFDSLENAENIFGAISRSVPSKSDPHTKALVTTVKALFDNMDRL